MFEKGLIQIIKSSRDDFFARSFKKLVVSYIEENIDINFKEKTWLDHRSHYSNFLLYSLDYVLDGTINIEDPVKTSQLLLEVMEKIFPIGKASNYSNLYRFNLLTVCDCVDRNFFIKHGLIGEDGQFSIPKQHNPFYSKAEKRSIIVSTIKLLLFYNKPKEAMDVFLKYQTVYNLTSYKLIISFSQMVIKQNHIYLKALKEKNQKDKIKQLFNVDEDFLKSLDLNDNNYLKIFKSLVKRLPKDYVSLLFKQTQNLINEENVDLESAIKLLKKVQTNLSKVLTTKSDKKDFYNAYNKSYFTVGNFKLEDFYNFFEEEFLYDEKKYNLLKSKASSYYDLIIKMLYECHLLILRKYPELFNAVHMAHNFKDEYARLLDPGSSQTNTINFYNLMEDIVGKIYDEQISKVVKSIEHFKEEEKKEYVIKFFNEHIGKYMPRIENIYPTLRNENIRYQINNDVEILYNRIKHNKTIINLLTAAQHNFDNFENNLFIGIDYVPLVVVQIKALERYLGEITLQKYPKYIRTKNNTSLPEEMLEGLTFERLNNFENTYLTMGSMIKFINKGKYTEKRNTINQSIFRALRINNKFGYPIDEFLQKVRNGFFHIDIISTYEKAMEIHYQTSYWFARVIDDINFELRAD